MVYHYQEMKGELLIYHVVWYVIYHEYHVILLWCGLGRPVITPKTGNWSVFVLFGWRFVFGVFKK